MEKSHDYKSSSSNKPIDPVKQDSIDKKSCDEQKNTQPQQAANSNVDKSTDTNKKVL